MGQQQLLLIILGVIIVGVAIAVGISMFSGQSTQSNKDAIISDLNNLGADAYQYKIRPVSMGGGGGIFTGYAIKTNGAWGSTNPNATYQATSVTDSTVTFLGTSKTVTGTVAITFGSNGQVSSGPTYTGQFL